MSLSGADAKSSYRSFCVTNPAAHSLSYIEREASFHCWCNWLRTFGVNGGTAEAWTSRLLVFRAGSESRLPAGCDRLEGNALDGSSFIGAVPESDVYVHLVGVAHPIYQEVRAQCEELIIKAGLNATILRPWYILGPRRWWPLVLTPIYSIAERFPATRAGALRLGRVRHHEMVRALANAVEAPAATGQRYFDVPGIRAA